MSKIWREEHELDIKDDAVTRRVWFPVSRIPDFIWSENPKRHDIGALIQTIERVGFKDAPRWNAHLPNTGGTQGAFTYGNGRAEALYRMWQNTQSYSVPDNVISDGDEWYMPLDVGLDEGLQQARAWALDHNSLSLSGGDYEDGDIWRLYDVDLLASVGADVHAKGVTPITLDEEQLSDLQKYVDAGQDSTPASVSNYTRKVESPIYEPSADCPAIEDLYDDSVTQRLVKKIEADERLDDETKAFLTIAAQRHTVLRFDKIADYYAHMPADVQAHMENSALVIIDFMRAIELGFVQLTDELEAQYRDEYES